MKYLLLLRGINVGGKNKVAMADLRTLLEDTGFIDMTTYINSGNVIFDSPLPQARVRNLVATVLSASYPFDILSLVMSGADYLDEARSAPPWWTEPLARRDALFLTSGVGMPHVQERIGCMTLGAELVHFGKRVVLWGKTDESQFLKTAYHKHLIKEGFYKLVTIRTLDVGGDKEISSMGAKREDNPLMGLRAIRYCLAREDVYRTQLRALLRASVFGDVRIMVPLITCVDEMREVRNLVRHCMEELDREGVTYNPDIQLGCMMETPAASLVADLLAAEADFFGIGTNDLTGYTMVADRGNDHVGYLCNTYDPAVLRSIRSIIEAGAQAGITVGMCGEAAADPLLIPLWIAFGLNEYSVSTSSVLSIRKQIFEWTVSDAQELAGHVMRLPTAHEAHDALQEAYDRRK